MVTGVGFVWRLSKLLNNGNQLLWQMNSKAFWPMFYITLQRAVKQILLLLIGEVHVNSCERKGRCGV